jgi:hypothetical protein
LAHPLPLASTEFETFRQEARTRIAAPSCPPLTSVVANVPH